jgi:hypothetical protein
VLAPENLAEVERWFIKRGLPHFIAEYSAGTDIWTRSRPALISVYVGVGIANGLNHHWSGGRNVVAAIASIALLAVLWMVLNVIRGRPLVGRPTRVGPPELGLIVLGPAIPPLLFGFQWRSAGLTVTGLGLALMVTFVVTSYGLVPMTRWATGRMIDSVSALGALFVRTLPMLLLFVTFLFINAEVWQVAGLLYGAAYPLVILTFFVLGAVFVGGRLPIDVREIGHFDSWAQAQESAHELGDRLPLPMDGTPADPRLGRKQWVNVGLVLLFSQGIVITLVGLGVSLFFVVFGTVAISRPAIETWTQTSELHVLVSMTLTGRELIVTEQLLRVAGFLGSFAALYFTVYLVTDPTYRQQFRSEIVTEVREAFAVRALYLAARPK